MRHLLNRTIGIVIILTSLIGIIFTSTGIYFVWKTNKPFTKKVTNYVVVAEKTLDLNTNALISASEALTTTSEIIVDINSSLLVLAQNTHEAGPLFESTANLLGEDLPDTIEATKISIDTAQDSAKLIDAVLRAVTAIPFFPGDKYEPEIPLHTALANVGKDLEAIPSTLQGMSEEIRVNKENIAEFETDLIGIALSIKKVNKNIYDAQKVISGYQELMLEFKQQTNKLNANLPAFIDKVCSIITIFLAWLGFTQIGLLTQGIEIIMRSNKNRENV